MLRIWHLFSEFFQQTLNYLPFFRIFTYFLFEFGHPWIVFVQGCRIRAGRLLTKRKLRLCAISTLYCQLIRGVFIRDATGATFQQGRIGKIVESCLNNSNVIYYCINIMILLYF